MPAFNEDSTDFCELCGNFEVISYVGEDGEKICRFCDEHTINKEEETEQGAEKF
jgi:hypothetical protein